MKVYQLFSYVTTFERSRTEYTVTVTKVGDVILYPEDVASYHFSALHTSRKAAIRELERVLAAAALFNEGEFEGWVMKSVWVGDDVISSESVKHLTAGRSFYVQLVEVK